LLAFANFSLTQIMVITLSSPQQCFNEFAVHRQRKYYESNLTFSEVQMKPTQS
jgi:hypothetical protein